ncbi:MAG: SH3 domain-containing protein [Oscillatoria sp. Prado101]|jgi:SH3-like domain-containing protein|nr:SH3 domain-containing protein [Oscillatoria sp. Prado101]
MLKPFTAIFAGILALNAGAAVQASPQPWGGLASQTGKIVAQQTGGTCKRVFDPKDTYANLRSTPNGQVVARLDNGITVSVKGNAGEWSKVEYSAGRVSGYIYTSLLTSCTGTCMVVADPNDTYVNLRSTPNGSVVARLNNGTRVYVYGRSNEWSWVEHEWDRGGMDSGYMFSRFLAPCGR